MNCPDKQILQDLVDDELDNNKAAQVTKHIRSCNKCKREFGEILHIYRGLREVVGEAECPSKDTLEKYAKNALSKAVMNDIKEHLELCVSCSSFIHLLTASEAELARWQAEEERSYQEFRDKYLGYEASKQALGKLLPKKLEVFDKIWNSVLKLALDLRTKAVEQWPTFVAPEQLAGALGFSDASDPETSASSIILVTTLLVAQQIADGELEKTSKEIERAVQIAANRLGAGKELQKKLIETVPEILLNSLN
jgi:hypothetical protein